MSGAAGWTRRARDVGEAYLGVVRAELAELAADLGRSGRTLVRALALLAATAAIGFWILGLLLYFAIELLALRLPRWGAVGIVLALFVVVALALGWAARRRIAAIESPAATVGRRLEEHQRWWRERVISETESEAAANSPQDGGES